ncbi:MAG: hypothetical protein F9K25_20465 [Candidatus Contendobacter sp.]|nr:MAG: hypothetical protein F9K25_20465 [Candidatus Contendobacter sp.]
MSETQPKYIPQIYIPPLPSVLVCPHCKRQVGMRREGADWREVYQCQEHGRVTPMRSAVSHRGAEWPDWSAA